MQVILLMHRLHIHTHATCHVASCISPNIIIISWSTMWRVVRVRHDKYLITWYHRHQQHQQQWSNQHSTVAVITTEPTPSSVQCTSAGRAERTPNLQYSGVNANYPRFCNTVSKFYKATQLARFIITRTEWSAQFWNVSNIFRRSAVS